MHQFIDRYNDIEEEDYMLWRIYCRNIINRRKQECKYFERKVEQIKSSMMKNKRDKLNIYDKVKYWIFRHIFEYKLGMDKTIVLDELFENNNKRRLPLGSGIFLPDFI